jgi:hypothetical protein
MSTTPPNASRFLPTLTEIVDPSVLGQMAPSEPQDFAAMLQALSQQVAPVIERRLRETSEALIRTLVERQMLALSEQLRLDLDAAIQQAISEYSPRSAAQDKPQ